MLTGSRLAEKPRKKPEKIRSPKSKAVRMRERPNAEQLKLQNFAKKSPNHSSAKYRLLRRFSSRRSQRSTVGAKKANNALVFSVVSLVSSLSCSTL